MKIWAPSTTWVMYGHPTRIPSKTSKQLNLILLENSESQAKNMLLLVIQIIKDITFSLESNIVFFSMDFLFYGHIMPFKMSTDPSNSFIFVSYLFFFDVPYESGRFIDNVSKCRESNQNHELGNHTRVVESNDIEKVVHFQFE